MKILEKGKLPPQAVDLEEAVLGAMMIDNKGLDDAFEVILKPEVFYKQAHKFIFSAIKSLYKNNDKIDLLTVSNKLRTQGKLEKVGGDFYLVNLTQKVASSAHVEYHSRIILQQYIKRELIKNSAAIIENCYNETSDALKLLDSAYDHLNNVSEQLVQNKEINVKELTGQILDRGGKMFRKEISPGIETPIRDLTKVMGGWRNDELIIMAGRPGMGKTSFVLKSAWYAAIKGIPVGMFSLEMSSEKLMSRIWSMECRINGNKFSKDGLSPDDQAKITTRILELGNPPFYIDDTSSLNIQTLRIKAKRMKREHNVQMIVIDYLQLMSGNSSSREQEISAISRGLKEISGELNIPVIALSQLSRAVEKRENKRPLLSDLRESGAIEQDADVVMFFYRPEYYSLTEWDDYDRVPCAGEAEYIVAKNRNGGLIRNRMKFEAQYTLFSNLDDSFNHYEKPLPNLEPNDVFENSDIQNNGDMPF